MVRTRAGLNETAFLVANSFAVSGSAMVEPESICSCLESHDFCCKAKRGTDVMAKHIERDLKREATGWISIAVVMLLFPALFFLCVFFPIWVGLTPRW